MLAPWVLGYDEAAAIVNSMAVGLVMAASAAIKGKVEKRYGSGWSDYSGRGANVLSEDALQGQK